MRRAHRENPGVVLCKFPAEAKTAVAALEPGGKVTIRGRCTGRLANLVMLEGCVFLPGPGGKVAAAVRKTLRRPWATD